MPITDNTFDAAEFEAAVTANPALLAAVRPGLTKLGITPYTAEEHTAAINTAVGQRTNEIYTGLDRDLHELTGLSKEGTEKTHEFLKRAVSGLKTDLTARQSKIAELEVAVAAGTADPVMKAQLAELQKKETDWQAKEKTYGTSLFEKDVLLDLRLGQVGLKLNDALPASLQKLALQNAERTVLAMAKANTVDGKTSIVYMRNGEVAMHEGKVATAADLLREELKDVLDTGHQGAGGGGNGGQGGGGGNKPRVDDKGNVIVPYTLPADVKNQGQLLDWLIKLGVPQDTPQFDKAFGKFADKLPLQ